MGQSRWVRFGGLGGLGWVVGLGFGLGCLRWVGWMCSIVFDLLDVQLILCTVYVYSEKFEGQS